MRDKPSSNRLERLYAQLVDADARARPTRTAASGATCSSTRTRRSTCTPTRSTPGRCSPTASRARATCSACYRPPRQRPAHARRAVDQPAAQQPRPRRGHRPRRQRPAGAADARLPLRPAVAPRGRGGVVRRPHPGRPRRRAPRAGARQRCGAPRASGARARADPGRGGRADRARGHRRGPDRADRDGGAGVSTRARPLPLRDPRRAARRGARLLLRAAPATRGSRAATCPSAPRTPSACSR